MATNTITKPFLDVLEETIPELASSRDLVKLGLFASEAAVSKARKNGHSPDYIQFSPGRIRYPRYAVIEFFKKRMKSGSCKSLHHSQTCEAINSSTQS